MLHHHEPEPYRWLAEYYDEVFAPLRVPVANARRRLLRKILPQTRSMCDLACGTGETALEYARRGIRTFAVDLSPGMCEATVAKAEREHVKVTVIQSDMRSFRLPCKVDLVTCENDALNHLGKKSDLARVLRCVALALLPGGWFLFDANNARGFKRYWTGNVWFEKPGIVLMMRNGHSKNLQRAWSDVEWFLRDGESWKRHHERVEEVCWSRVEIERAMQAAGFEQLRAWDAAPYFRGDPFVTRGCHTIYLARKAGSRISPASVVATGRRSE